MYIIGIEVTLRFYQLDSLKGKRKIIKSILDKARHKFQISTAEVGSHDSLDGSVLGFGLVSNSRVQAEKVLQKVINFIDTQSEVEIVHVEWIEA